MSVNPGFGGQEFISGTYDKIRELVALKEETRTEFLIQIDGGVGEKNIEKLTSAGAQVLVAGSSVFTAENRREQIQRVLELAQSGATGHLIACRTYQQEKRKVYRKSGIDRRDHIR